MAVISRRNLVLIQSKTKQALALATILLLTASTFAQQPTPTPDSQDTTPPLMDKAANGKDVLVTIPAGTRIALVLTQPLIPLPPRWRRCLRPDHFTRILRR